MKNAWEEIQKDPARLKAFMREVVGPPHRELKDTEYTEIWFLLQLMEPISSSNNQHTSTDVYKMSGNEYRVTYWPNASMPTIDEYLPEEI